MGLSDVEKACSFSITLSADEAVWFEVLEEEMKGSWTELKAAFRNRFVDNWRAEIIKKIRAKQQGKEETVETLR